MRRLAGTSALACVAGLLASCSGMNDWYNPPSPRRPEQNVASYHAPTMIEMSDANAATWFLRDINSTADANGWRWTGKTPTLRIVLDDERPQRLVMDLTVPQPTYQLTGPVNITIRVNDHELATVPCSASKAAEPIFRHVDQPVPEEWLRPHGENVISAEIDKTARPSPNGPELGFILTRVGLRPR